MPEDKTFQYAFLFSVLLHSVFFITLPHVPFTPDKRSLNKIEITYYKIKEPSEKKEITANKIEPAPGKLPEIKKEDIVNPPKPALKKTENVTPVHVPKATVAIGEIKEKKFEAVVQEEKDDAKKATYISYYKAVREKIRQCADRNYPRNKSLGAGEVFLSFVVASSGELLQVRVIDEKSVNFALLRNIAINSIRDASPFPGFPKGMSQYQITFNVIISFESR